jgi:hypothetical protein
LKFCATPSAAEHDRLGEAKVMAWDIIRWVIIAAWLWNAIKLLARAFWV